MLLTAVGALFLLLFGAGVYWLLNRHPLYDARKPAPVVKPRISWGWCYLHGFGVEVPGWRCEHGGVTGNGTTPAEAYRAWERSFMPLY